MNKLIATICASLLLVATGSAIAGDGPGKHGRQDQRGPEGPMMMDFFKHELRQLDLSDEQKADVKVIMQDLREQSQLIGEELRANQEQLKDLIQADSWDEAAAAKLAAKEGDLSAQRTLLTSKALADIYAQLTVEQRAELAVQSEERQERHAAMREAHRDRMPIDE